MNTRVLIALVFCLFCVSPAWAGPPFVTDDPEPVDLGHWEVYLSSMLQRDSSGSSGTLPHVEVNYGAAPNLQLHVILPYAFNHPVGGNTAHGLGDVELGVKYRFVQETDHCPMVGAFPLVEAPTGNGEEGLGTGHFQLFLPIWVQKSWGRWTADAGGGYFINPGEGNRSYWLAGWEVQKDLDKHLTLGGELFGMSPTMEGGRSELDFNLGGEYNIDDGHHILFSAGRGMSGDEKFMSYVGYQWTFGPLDKK